MSRRVCEGEALLACRLVVKSPFVPFRPLSLYPCQSTFENCITVGQIIKSYVREVIDRL
jgi:hypothetical protein